MNNNGKEKTLFLETLIVDFPVGYGRTMSIIQLILYIYKKDGIYRALRINNYGIELAYYIAG